MPGVATRPMGHFVNDRSGECGFDLGPTESGRHETLDMTCSLNKCAYLFA